MQVYLNEWGKVYYCYSKAGTKQPSAADIVAGITVQNGVEQTCGSDETNNKLKSVLNLKKLKPATNYVTYVTAVDSNNNPTSQVEKVNFTTLKRYNDSKFTCVTIILSSVDVIHIALSIALAVPKANLIFIGVDPNLLFKGRMLQDTSATY